MERTCRVSNLKVARVAANKFQRHLAAACGRSVAYICRLETGRSYAKLTPEIAYQIGEAVGVPASVLFGKKGEIHGE